MTSRKDSEHDKDSNNRDDRGEDRDSRKHHTPTVSDWAVEEVDDVFEVDPEGEITEQSESENDLEKFVRENL